MCDASGFFLEASNNSTLASDFASDFTYDIACIEHLNITGMATCYTYSVLSSLGLSFASSKLTTIAWKYT